jgi:hypothetical protein
MKLGVQDLPTDRCSVMNYLLACGCVIDEALIQEETQIRELRNTGLTLSEAQSAVEARLNNSSKPSSAG